ncbi:MAG: class I SAM-dependent methyltransferase [Candidatus ainarchaeum sp.]|nr:class I SAM-dependent methyltransferase [Candidatus ainarchaeum sp.]
MKDAYFNTKEGIDAYEASEPVNAQYNLDLLALGGISLQDVRGVRVLDLGCGWGLLLKKFHDAGASCFGTDISALSVSKCRERFPGISVEQADCTKNPFREKFSLVMSFGVLGLVTKNRHALFLQNAAGALEDGGVLVASAPNAARSGLMDALSGRKRSASYGNARTVAEWKDMLEKAGFADICVESVLRVPNAEKLLGRNIFLAAGGSGDPIVIFARRQALKQS